MIIGITALWHNLIDRANAHLDDKVIFSKDQEYTYDQKAEMIEDALNRINTQYNFANWVCPLDSSRETKRALDTALLLAMWINNDPYLLNYIKEETTAMFRIIEVSEWDAKAEILYMLWESSNAVISSQMVNNDKFKNAAKELIADGVIVENNGELSVAPYVVIVAQWTDHNVYPLISEPILTPEDFTHGYDEIEYGSAPSLIDGGDMITDPVYVISDTEIYGWRNYVHKPNNDGYVFTGELNDAHAFLTIAEAEMCALKLSESYREAKFLIERIQRPSDFDDSNLGLFRTDRQVEEFAAMMFPNDNARALFLQKVAEHRVDYPPYFAMQRALNFILRATMASNDPQ